MKASNSLWKEHLAGKMPEDLAREVDNFETEIDLRKQEKIEERVFAETRLRRGVYGQRYDNGHRYDGYGTRELAFPDVPTKGPETFWDAPGMQRIKLPYGGLSPEQIEVVADWPRSTRTACCTSRPGRTSSCTTSTSRTRPT